MEICRHEVPVNDHRGWSERKRWSWKLRMTSCSPCARTGSRACCGSHGKQVRVCFAPLPGHGTDVRAGEEDGLVHGPEWCGTHRKRPRPKGARRGPGPNGCRRGEDVGRFEQNHPGPARAGPFLVGSVPEPAEASGGLSCCALPRELDRTARRGLLGRAARARKARRGAARWMHRDPARRSRVAAGHGVGPARTPWRWGAGLGGRCGHTTLPGPA